MIGRWLREGRLWAVAAMVIVAALLPTTTVAASTFIYDAPADTRVDTCAFAASAVGLPQLSDAQEASAALSVEPRGTSTTPHATFDATEAGSIRNVNPLGGTNNCVNCAVATDATLSGAPASALNVAPGVSGQPISILEDLYGGAFKPVSGQTGIESILGEAGSGSRGIVFGARGNDVGHVFNAVNQNGAIRFLDGQTGGVASFKGYTDFWFLATG